MCEQNDDVGNCFPPPVEIEFVNIILIGKGHTSGIPSSKHARSLFTLTYFDGWQKIAALIVW